MDLYSANIILTYLALAFVLLAFGWYMLKVIRNMFHHDSRMRALLHRLAALPGSSFVDRAGIARGRDADVSSLLNEHSIPEAGVIKVNSSDGALFASFREASAPADLDFVVVGPAVLPRKSLLLRGGHPLELTPDQLKDAGCRRLREQDGDSAVTTNYRILGERLTSFESSKELKDFEKLHSRQVTVEVLNGQLLLNTRVSLDEQNAEQVCADALYLARDLQSRLHQSRPSAAGNRGAGETALT